VDLLVNVAEIGFMRVNLTGPGIIDDVVFEAPR